MKKVTRNQTEKKQHGGARPGSGRRHVDTVPKMLKLSPENVAWLAEESDRRKALGETGVSQSSIADALIAAARKR